MVRNKTRAALRDAVVEKLVAWWDSRPATMGGSVKVPIHSLSYGQLYTCRMVFAYVLCVDVMFPSVGTLSVVARVDPVNGKVLGGYFVNEGKVTVFA